MTLSHEVAPGDRTGVEPTDGSVTRPVGAIVTDLWEKTEMLVRQEMRLGIAEAEEKVDALKVELEGKVQHVKAELVAKALGGVVAFSGALTIIAGIVALLALVMAVWLAALLVGAALALGGAVLLKRDTAASLAVLVPQRTVEQHETKPTRIEKANHDTAEYF
jgi:hypothetical protein